MARLRPALRIPASALLLGMAAVLASCENPAGSGGPGEAARVDIVTGDLQSATVGTELDQPLVARVVDGKGKPVPGQLVNFRVVAGEGAVFAGSGVTNAQGEVRERWKLGTVAGDTQRVEARAVDAATGEPLVFAVFRAIGRADAPAAISPVGEAVRMGTAGFPLADSLAVRVLDRFGNGVDGATVAWTARTGGGTVSPATSTADAQGVARAQWTLGMWLDSTQVAEAAAAVGITTSFVAAAGVPAGVTLAVRGGDGQTGTVGTTLPQPVKVALLLPDGRPVAGATVAWSVGATGGSVAPSTSVTDAAGEAVAQWTLPTMAGPATLTAQTPGALAVSFTAAAAPGAAVSLVRVSGDGQAPTAGAPLPADLVVRAEDAHGNGVPGVTVAWTTSNGTLSPASTPTGADGTARSRWTPATAAASSATATAAGLPPVTFTTQSQSGITIQFRSPTDAPVTFDFVDVAVVVQSTYTVTSVTAAVGAQTITLARSSDGAWVGRIPLDGVPAGTHTVVVSVMDAAGGRQTAEKTFTLDRRPTVEFRSPPVEGSVQPVGPVRIIAVCRDDAASGCAFLEVKTRDGTTVGSGKDSVDFTFTAGSAGDTVSLYAWGTDTRGTTWNVGTFYVLESGPRLVEVAALGGHVLDFDGARALYQARADHDLRIRTVAGGAEQTVPTPGTDVGDEQWKLTPRGALFTQGPVFPDGVRIYEWRDGTTVDLGPISYYERNRAYFVQPIQVEGTWAAWSGPDGLVRRDLSAGTNVAVGSAHGDLAANGDVVFTRRLTDGSPAEVMRLRGGTLSQVATAASASGARTDGVNVLAVLDSALVLITPTGTDTVAQPVEFAPEAGTDVVDGWTVYSRRTGTGGLQLWLRSPTGVEYNPSSLLDSATLATLGPDGQLVFQASGRLWYYRPGQSAVDIASDSGTPMWRGGELYIRIANSVFRVIR